MENFNVQGAIALSREELMEVLGGQASEPIFADDPVGCHKCCNQWGCGECGCGTRHDCSMYGPEAYVKDC